MHLITRVPHIIQNTFQCSLFCDRYTDTDVREFIESLKTIFRFIEYCQQQKLLLIFQCA